MNGFIWILIIIFILVLLAMCDIHGAGGTATPPPATQAALARQLPGGGNRKLLAHAGQPVPADPLWIDGTTDDPADP